MQVRASHASQACAHQQGAAPAQLPRPPQLPRPAFTELPMHQHTAACPPLATPPQGARSTAEAQPGKHTQPLQQRQQQPMPHHLQSSQVKVSAAQSPTAQAAVHLVSPCQHGGQPGACSLCHQRLQQVQSAPGLPSCRLRSHAPKFFSCSTGDVPGGHPGQPTASNLAFSAWFSPLSEMADGAVPVDCRILFLYGDV